jgi:hypothetical protein
MGMLLVAIPIQMLMTGVAQFAAMIRFFDDLGRSEPAGVTAP